MIKHCGYLVFCVGSIIVKPSDPTDIVHHSNFYVSEPRTTFVGYLSYARCLVRLPLVWISKGSIWHKIKNLGFISRFCIVFITCLLSFCP